MRFWLIVVATGSMILGGCNKTESVTKDPVEDIHLYGELSGLSLTHHKGLQDELALITAEKGTPRLLTSGPLLKIGKPKRGDVPLPDDENNAAVALARIFTPGVLTLVDKKARKLYPQGLFQFDAVSLEKVIEFRVSHEKHRLLGREAISRPFCNYRLQHMDGLATDTSLVDVARVCVRLEAFLIAELLATGEPEKTIEPLAAMFRQIGFLANEKHVIPRMTAAHLRIETLGVLEAIAKHSLATRSTHEDLYNLLKIQFATWPSDANAWIGDRALGMHMYEMIRDGHLFSILSPEEVDEFRESGSMISLGKAVVGSIDIDEYYYLQTMRTIIENCEAPFYRRVAVFNQMREHLHEIRATSEFPLIAARILLPEIEEGHRVLAKERATAEIWLVALAAAIGLEETPYKVNPLTGEMYRLTQNSEQVKVAGLNRGSADRPLVLSLPSEKTIPVSVQEATPVKNN